MSRLVEWAKANPVVTRVELFVFVRNEPAIHLYETFGFAVEGRRRKAIYRNGEYHDDLIMALLV
jgi:putative acetyltransferase